MWTHIQGKNEYCFQSHACLLRPLGLSLSLLEAQITMFCRKFLETRLAFSFLDLFSIFLLFAFRWLFVHEQKKDESVDLRAWERDLTLSHIDCLRCLWILVIPPVMTVMVLTMDVMVSGSWQWLYFKDRYYTCCRTWE